MSARRILGIGCIIVIIAMAFSTAASASPNSVALSTPKSINIVLDPTVCSNSVGEAFPCMVFGNGNVEVDNNTSAPATCSLFVSDFPFDLIGGATLAPGGYIQPSLTMPYTGQKSLTFTLTCVGIKIPHGKQKVQVVVPVG